MAAVVSEPSQASIHSVGILASRTSMEGRRWRLTARQGVFSALAHHIGSSSDGTPVLTAFGSAFEGRARGRGMKHGVPIPALRRALAAAGPVVDGTEFYSSRTCSSCGAAIHHPTHQRTECSLCGAKTPRDETSAQLIQ